ncbi:hypothetical protein CRENBAI_020968 [Crenichthys baileyi]|uniref:Uncharacterized protein n=1 Tax=Crenichthys baileyi TaxID=28760 RepID=A0AAV9RBT0_9TELE
MIPATYRSRRTCPPSTAIKQPNSSSTRRCCPLCVLGASNLPHRALFLVSPNPSPPGGVLTQPTPAVYQSTL